MGNIKKSPNSISKAPAKVVVNVNKVQGDLKIKSKVKTK